MIRGVMADATPDTGAAAAAATAAIGTPADIVAQLLSRDAVSQWLGVELLEVAVGRATLRMPVRADFVNGFGTVHGGVLFSLADSAFAFATNAGGLLSVAIDCTISFPVAVRPGDVLTAEAVEQARTNRLAFCEVTVRNQENTTVAFFRGTVYRTTRVHESTAKPKTGEDR